jgi:DNA-binding NtrC family response regulator/tetratricopeptide (TPR) repeat protein
VQESKAKHSRTPQSASRSSASARSAGLGDLYLSTSDFVHAEEEFTSQLVTAAGSERATLLRKIGLCRERRGEQEAALGALAEAEAEARASDDPLEGARASLHIGKVLFYTGDLDGAEVRAEAARQVLRETELIADRGLAENLLGGIAYRRGELDRARRHFEKSVILGKEGQDMTLLARGYNNLGLIHKEMCDWDQAVDCFQASLGFDSTAANYDARVTAWINLGIVHQKRSEWKEAAAMFRRAHKTCVEVGNRLGQVRSLLGLAAVHRGERAWPEAERCLDQAVEIVEHHRYPRELALTHVQRAWIALDRSEPEVAARELALSTPVVEQMSTQGELASHLARLSAHVAMAAGETALALARARQAATLAKACNDRYELATAARVEGVALCELGRWPEANEVFDRGVRSLRRMGERHELGLTLLAWGEGEASAVQDREVCLGLDRLLEASSLLAAVNDLPAHVRAQMAIARIDHQRGRSAEALDAMHRAWTGAGQIEHLDSELHERLIELQRSIEGDILERTTPERNRVVALLDLVSQAARAKEGSALGRFLEQLAELFEAEGAALLASPDGTRGSWRSEAASGLRPQEKRALLALLEQHGDALAEQTFFYTTEAQGAAVLAGSALISVRPVGSCMMLAVSDESGQPWVLYFDRKRDGSPDQAFAAAELELLAALRDRLPGLLANLGGSDDRVTRRASEEDLLERDGFIGSAPGIREILAKLARIRGSSIRVLLQGETGTGKGQLARIIHQNSVRGHRPFRVLNCATLPDTLLESELFGHVKGSFTGAISDKVGLLEEAEGGTIFLDDIEKAGGSVQRGLLHFLDCGEIRPVGSTRRRRLDVRIICATSSPDLAANVRAGTFSKDLFYRLQHFTITVPPLRERREDILPLAGYFLTRFAEEHGGGPRDLDDEVARRLVEHDWPGNVRELENAVRHAVALGLRADVVTLSLLPPPINQPAGEALPDPRHGRLSDLVEAFETERVRAALIESGGNKSRAAESLGLTRKGLRNKIRRYGISGFGS